MRRGELPASRIHRAIRIPTAKLAAMLPLPALAAVDVSDAEHRPAGNESQATGDGAAAADRSTATG